MMVDEWPQNIIQILGDMYALGDTPEAKDWVVVWDEGLRGHYGDFEGWNGQSDRYNQHVSI